MTKESDGARLPGGAPAADVRATGEGSALAGERPAKPYPKASQLARGERRYRRKVASPKQWQAIHAEKIAGCGCRMALYCFPGSQQAHHLVSRAQGGDDVADNIVPLCPECHDLVTRRDQYALARLASRLDARERAYVVGKLGEGGMERLFGVAWS